MLGRFDEAYAAKLSAELTADAKAADAKVKFFSVTSPFFFCSSPNHGIVSLRCRVRVNTNLGSSLLPSPVRIVLPDITASDRGYVPTSASPGTGGVRRKSLMWCTTRRDALSC